MKSPTLKGLNVIISTPPAKFASPPCSASPTANPAAASIAMKEVISTPSIDIAVISTNTLRSIEKKLVKKCLSDASIFDFFILLSANLLSIFTIQNPKIITNIAATSFGAKA